MRVTHHSAASNELTEAAEFYESRTPGLGLQFVEEVELAIARILSDPQIRVRTAPNSAMFSASISLGDLLPRRQRAHSRAGDQAP